MKKFLLTALCATLPLIPLPAQMTVDLPVSLGAKTDENTQTNYSLSSSGQPSQNLQEVRFLMTRAATIKGTTETKTTTITLRTGRQKTVAQLTAMLAEVLQKFINGAAPGTVLGTLGNVEKGGAVDFVAESADSLRFDFQTPNAPVSSSHLTRTDAEMFAAMLK